MTVVITGGSGAIGSMCAYEAAKNKYDIVLCYNKNKDGAQSVVNMLSGFDVKILPVCADISEKSGIGSFIVETDSEISGLFLGFTE